MQRLALCALLAAAAAAQPFPEAEISNGLVTAKFYLPDAERGYYRGTRFDWSGQIYSLRANGHEYFGQWFEKYDPKLHDAIMGPVEEFRSAEGGLGYAAAEPGGVFVRIGVGAVRKPDNTPFQPFRTYDIVQPGKWEVRKGTDWIEFTHLLADAAGYGYRYTKTIRLAPGKTEMSIEHTLANTGKLAIRSMQYNHNFFMFDGQPSGPGAVVQFPFELKAVRAFQGGVVEARGREIGYTRELAKGESAIGEFSGFATAADYDIRMEHRGAGAGVRIQGDRPIARLVFWTIRTTFCPEPYIDLSVEPGAATSWRYSYQFYALK